MYCLPRLSEDKKFLALHLVSLVTYHLALGDVSPLFPRSLLGNVVTQDCEFRRKEIPRLHLRPSGIVIRPTGGDKTQVPHQELRDEEFSLTGRR